MIDFSSVSYFFQELWFIFYGFSGNAVVPVVGGIFGLVLIIKIWKGMRKKVTKRTEKEESLRFIFFRVKSPMREDEKEQNENDFKTFVSVCQQFVHSLHSLLGERKSGFFGTGETKFSFEIVVQNKEIFFYVGFPVEFDEFFEKQITSFFPRMNVERVDEFNIFLEDSEFLGSEMKLKNNVALPIKIYEEMANDPLSNITNALSKLGDGDGAVIQLVMSPVGDGWVKKGRKNAETLTKGEKKSKGLLAIIFGPFWYFVAGDFEKMHETKDEKPHEASNTDQKKAGKMEEKCADLGFDVSLRILTSASTVREAEVQMRNIRGAYSQFTDPDSNAFEVVKQGGLAKIFSAKKYQRKIVDDFVWRGFGSGKAKFVLNAKEIATVFHFANAKFNKTAAIAWQKFKAVEAPSDLVPLTPDTGIFLGYNNARGQKKEIWMKHEDRFRHFYTIGQTGMGKSVNMITMAIQDLMHPSRRGMCCMDPHGALADDLIPYIPKSRADDFIYFNPADLERPIGLNILEVKEGEDEDFIINEIMSMMISLYGEEIFSPRLQDYFRNGVSALIADKENPGALVDIVQVFVNEPFQKEKRAKIKNPITRQWWDKTFDGMADREKQEMIPYFAAKFTSFISNAMMRNVIGQSKSSFDFYDSMNSGKIMMCNLSKGLLGDFNAKLLGMMFTMKITAATLRRQEILSRGEKPRDFFFYIDEFQNFLTDSVESILSEARKYRLSLNVAHQYIAQLSQKGDDKIKNAIFGNVGSMFAMSISPEDAEFIEKKMAPSFTADDIVNFNQFSGALRLTNDGLAMKPFLLNSVGWWEREKCIPGHPKENKKLADVLKQMSRLKYGRPKEIVEKEILTRLQAL